MANKTAGGSTPIEALLKEKRKFVPAKEFVLGEASGYGSRASVSEPGGGLVTTPLPPSPKGPAWAGREIGGSLTVRSTLGQGSSFRMALPLVF